MRTAVQYLNKLIFPLLPETKCFGIKRSLLRLAGATIGRNVRICSSAMIIGAGKLSIDDNTWVGHRVVLIASSSIRIGKNVDIAPNVFIGNGTHRITPDKDRIADIELSKDIVIGDGCWLCVNSTILPGTELAKKVVVGAGAVVGSVFKEDCILIVGIPAKKIKSYV